MPATRQQLADAVLRNQGLLGDGVSPSASDQQYIMEQYDLKYAELAAHGNEYVYWAINEIPDAVFMAMRDLVWNEVRTAFGMPIEADQKEAAETTIMRKIRRHVSTQPSGLPTPACYF